MSDLPMKLLREQLGEIKKVLSKSKESERTVVTTRSKVRNVSVGGKEYKVCPECARAVPVCALRCVGGREYMECPECGCKDQWGQTRLILSPSYIYLMSQLSHKRGMKKA